MNKARFESEPHNGLRVDRISNLPVRTSMCHLCINSRFTGLLVDFLYFKKIKVGLWYRLAICAFVCLCLYPPNNFRVPESIVIKLGMYEGESAKRTQMEATALMGIIGFLYVSLGSSTVQLHDNIGSRRLCAKSEAGFSSQIGDRAWMVYHLKAVFCCMIFVDKWAQCKGYS
jgi:hypothetical protein